jgi:hypothetical protein
MIRGGHGAACQGVGRVRAWRTASTSRLMRSAKARATGVPLPFARARSSTSLLMSAKRAVSMVSGDRGMGRSVTGHERLNRYGAGRLVLVKREHFFVGRRSGESTDRWLAEQRADRSARASRNSRSGRSARPGSSCHDRGDAAWGLRPSFRMARRRSAARGWRGSIVPIWRVEGPVAHGWSVSWSNRV